LGKAPEGFVKYSSVFEENMIETFKDLKDLDRKYFDQLILPLYLK